jgi:probable HAF family extracellular repeat protein
LCFGFPASARTFLLDSSGKVLSEIGGLDSYASGINNAGQVEEGSYTAAGQVHAFITGPNGVGMTDLNSLVDLPGVILTSAAGINNVGEVMTGSVPNIRSRRSMHFFLQGLD